MALNDIRVWRMGPSKWVRFSYNAGAKSVLGWDETGNPVTITPAAVAFTGNYNDLAGKPTLFDGSYASLSGKPTLFSGVYTDLTAKPNFAAVAFSGNYTDLANRPVVPSGQIQSDWTQSSTTALDYIRNKPTLFSGAYSDLTGKPTIPTATSLATTLPAALGTPAIGVAATAARADHVHQAPYISGGSAATSAVLLAAGSVDVTVPLDVAMPNTTYRAVAVLTNSSLSVLGALGVTVKTKNLTSVIVTLKNTGLATIVAGQVIEVIAFTP